MSRFAFAVPRLLLCLVLLSPLVAFAGTVVRVSSAVGDFHIELFDDTAPGTVANFLKYVNSGAYNGTVVHRLIPGFVFQGGWLSFNEGQQSFSPLATTGNIQNEFAALNRRGTIAMAKVGGRSQQCQQSVVHQPAGQSRPEHCQRWLHRLRPRAG